MPPFMLVKPIGICGKSAKTRSVNRVKLGPQNRAKDVRDPCCELIQSVNESASSFGPLKGTFFLIALTADDSIGL